jgi:MoxR-like ATPase
MPTKPVAAPTRARRTRIVEQAEEIQPIHPLAHLIPPMQYATNLEQFVDANGKAICPKNCSEHVHGGNYVSRSVYGYADFELLKYAARCDPPKNVRLYGPAGPGKTSMIMAYCATYKIPLVTINANGGIDPNSFFGQWEPKHGVDTAEVMRIMGEVKSKLPVTEAKDMNVVMPITMAIIGQEKFHYVYSDVVNVIRHGGFLFIDEANFMGGKVSAVWNSLTDGRRFITILDNGNEVVKAADNFQFAIAYNPEYEGTRPLNESFSDRFDIVINVDYDREVEEQLVWMPAVLDLASKLRDAQKQGTLRTPVSTRKLVAFETFCQDVGLEFAVLNFVAGFHADERQAVKEVVSNFEADLQEQLKELQSYTA